MSNLLFALNATMPLFLLIALGFFLKKVNILSDGFLKSANKFNFTVTLPVLLFNDLAHTDFKDTFDIKFLLFCAIATSIGFWGIWLIARFTIKDRAARGEFVQAAFRSSTAVMGIALIKNIYGSTGMGGMMVLGCVPLYNIYSVILLHTLSPDREKSEGNKSSIGSTLKGIVTNPIIIAVILGFLSSLISIDYPHIIDRSLEYVANLATPLALICIGGEFSFKNALANIKLSAIASFVKLILLAVIFTTIAVIMGFRTEKLIAIFIMLAGPTTPSCFIMAKQYGYKGVITSSAVVLTTLFASVTLTVMIYILKSMGFI